MQADDPTPSQIFQLSQEILRKLTHLDPQVMPAVLKLLNEFACSNGISFENAFFYLNVGAINFHKLDDTWIMFAPVTPTQAGEMLKTRSKHLSRRFANLAGKGLLVLEIGGGYKVADIKKWFQLSRSIKAAL